MPETPPVFAIQDLNLRQMDYHSIALTTELIAWSKSTFPRAFNIKIKFPLYH